MVEGGLSGVLLDERVPICSGLTQGCAPIGPVRRITECEGSVVLQIDHQPALEALKSDIGELLSRDLRRVAGLIFVARPVAGADRPDYLVRNLLAIDPQRGWIAIGGEVARGDPIMFCRRDRASAAEDLGRMLTGLKRLSGGAHRAGIYFSCVGRGPGFFGNDGELEAIRAELGDFPLVGFFGNGEIAHDRIYGYTGVLALFL
jgi:small ligand-binding sensory domain FIST